MQGGAVWNGIPREPGGIGHTTDFRDTIVAMLQVLLLSLTPSHMVIQHHLGIAPGLQLGSGCVVSRSGGLQKNRTE